MTTDNLNNTDLLDLRLSTFEQLQQKLGEANVFYIDSDGIKYPEIFFTILNDFLFVASNELPNAIVKMDDKPCIVFNNNSYAIHADNLSSYIVDMQILKDLNSPLEAQGSPKRFFYFDDIFDDCESGFFYTDKDFGLQLIDFLNNPPDYPEDDFTDHTHNRVVNMGFADSTTTEKASYFLRLLPDF